MQYSQAGPVLAIHIWTGLFVFLGVARGSWIMNEGITKYAFIINSIGAVSNIVLNYYLIPQYGIVGAAMATLISQMVSVLLLTALFKRTRKIFYCQIKALFLQMA